MFISYCRVFLGGFFVVFLKILKDVAILPSAEVLIGAS